VNFIDFLADPDIELIEKECNQVEKRGRPAVKRQRVHHALAEQMHVEQAEP